MGFEKASVWVVLSSDFSVCHVLVSLILRVLYSYVSWIYIILYDESGVK